MKKALVIILTLVMALSVVALASCGGKTYEGEYKYANPYASGSYYGAKVQVTVQGNVITKVVLLSDDESGYTNLSAGWTDTYTYSEFGQDSQGKTNWRLHHDEFLDSFVGLTIDEVLAMKVVTNKDTGEPVTQDADVETIKYAPAALMDTLIVKGHGDYVAGTGATQSSGRTILAIQNALKIALGLEDTTPNTIPVEMSGGSVVVPSWS